MTKRCVARLQKHWKIWLGGPALASAAIAVLPPALARQERAVSLETPAALPAVPANGEIGFIVDTFAPAIQPGMAENCPGGYAGTNSENYLASLRGAERARL